MKTIHHVFSLGYFGLADFLRGTAYLVNTFGNDYAISMPIMHPLREFLRHPGPYVWGDVDASFSCGSPQENGRFYDTVMRLLEEHDEITVRTNFFEEPTGVFPEPLKKLFALNDETEEKYRDFRAGVVGDRPFEVIHVRFDDHPGCREHKYADALAAMRTVDFLHDAEKVLLTNDARFREVALHTFFDLQFPTHPPTHTGFQRRKLANLATFFEMKLITHARRVTAFTTYDWGCTGFSRVPALLYGIPYSCRRI